jgi:hypothetical protein
LVRSFKDGVILSERSYTWIIEEELDKAREKLEEVKSLNKYEEPE